MERGKFMGISKIFTAALLSAALITGTQCGVVGAISVSDDPQTKFLLYDKDMKAEITSESTSESTETTETSTESSTEATSETSTEHSTEATSEASTESTSESTTTSAAETSTENTTEAATGKVSSDDSGKITDYDGNEEIVNIPESVNGVPVTSISADFLKNNDTVKNVVLPDTINNIEANALDGIEVYANINSKAAETVEEYNRNNPEKQISLNYIGDIDGEDGITNKDIQKILDYVRDTDDSLTDKEIQNAKSLFKIS